MEEKGEMDSYKEWFMTTGYKQDYGVDYIEVFVSVETNETIRMLIALVAWNSRPIFQLNVKSAFLHGVLEEVVFTKQPLVILRLVTNIRLNNWIKIL